MIVEGTILGDYTPYQGQTIPIDLEGNTINALPSGIKDKLLIDRKGNAAIERNVPKVVLDENSTISVAEIITSNNKFIWRYTTALDMAGSGSRSNIISNNYVGDTTVYGTMIRLVLMLIAMV